MIQMNLQHLWRTHHYLIYLILAPCDTTTITTTTTMTTKTITTTTTTTTKTIQKKNISSGISQNRMTSSFQTSPGSLASSCLVPPIFSRSCCMRFLSRLAGPFKLVSREMGGETDFQISRIHSGSLTARP